MLTTDQLQAIDRHLRKENWLLNEELINELKDHYIAGIEERMATGMPFDVAIQEIHNGFGGRKGLLKMEEEFQAQKAMKLDLYIWREVRLFLGGSRIAFSLALFVFLYWLNTYSETKEYIDSFFSTGLFIMTGSVFGPILASVLFFAKRSHAVNKAMLWPTTIGFYILYTIGVIQSLLVKYFPASYSPITSPIAKLWGSTLTETLITIYMIATGMGLRKLFQVNTKLA